MAAFGAALASDVSGVIGLPHPRASATEWGSDSDRDSGAWLLAS